MQERVKKPMGNGSKPLMKKESVSSVNGRTDEKQKKSVTNGTKTLVKKETVPSVKANGVVKRDSDSHGHKDSHAHNGARGIVKKSVTTVTKVTSVKTEEKKKKVFTLPGQKHDPPEEREAARIFYSSLLEQNPSSEMAEVWMMEHGLLEVGHAKKALERKQRRQQHEKNGTPVKSLMPSRDVSSKSASKLGSGKKTSGNKSSVVNGKSEIMAEQKGKRKREYSSDDDDFIKKPPVKRKAKA